MPLQPRTRRPASITLSVLALLSVHPLSLQAQGTAKTSPPKAAPQKGEKGQNLGKVYVAPPPGLALFEKALAATKAGKYAEAERLYRKLLKDTPDAAAAWANLGLLVGRQNRIHDAIDYLTKATQLDPETPALWAQRSAYELRGKQWRAAEQSARKALAREPANALAAADLGDALFQQRRYTEAVPVFQKLLEMEGSAPSGHTEISLILALSLSGKTREALAIAQHRTERLPKDVNAYLLLGDTARRAGDVALAAKAYKQAAVLDPKNQGAKAGLSVTAAMQGDRAAALKLINERLAKEPQNALLHYQKGFVLFSDARRPPEQRFVEAEGEFRRAAALDPKVADYQAYSGIALMLQGPFPHLPPEEKPPEGTRPYLVAENYLRGALMLNPKYTPARLALANIATERKEYDQALAHYQAILSYDPKNADAYRGRAGVYYAQRKRDLAYQEMETIARLYPKDTSALSELASWYAADNKAALAQSAYLRIVERDPGNAPAHIALGRMYEEDKKPTEAIQQYQAATLAQPKNRDAVLLLGNILTQQKRTDEAAAAYRHFLDSVPDENSVRWQLALLLKEKGQFEQALAEMQALTLRNDDPNRTVYLVSVPRLLIEQKRYEEAIRTLLQMQQEYPKENEIKYVLADAYEKAGQQDKAEALLKTMAARPTTPDPSTTATTLQAHIRLAEMYERAAQWDAAGTEYEEALRVDPMQTTALFALSRVRQKGNRTDAAVEFLEGLATVDEKEPSLPAVGGIHQLFVNDKQYDRWRDFTKRLLARYPDNRNARYIRARSLTEENNDAGARQEAVTLYQQILAKAPRDVEARRNLGKELEALGRKEEAIAAFRAIVEQNTTDTDAMAALKRLGAH